MRFRELLRLNLIIYININGTLNERSNISLLIFFINSSSQKNCNTDIRILFEVYIAPNLNGSDIYTKRILIYHAKLEIKLFSLSANDTCKIVILCLI